MKKNIAFLVVASTFVFACSSSTNSNGDNIQAENISQTITSSPDFVANLPTIKLATVKPDSSLMLQSKEVSLEFTQKYLNNIKFFYDTLCGDATGEVTHFVNQKTGKPQDEFTQKVDLRTVGLVSQTPQYVSVLYYVNHQGAEMCGAYNSASYLLVNHALDGKMIEGIILAEEYSGADAPYYSTSNKTSQIANNKIEMKIENVVGDGEAGKEDITLVNLSVQINENGTFSKIAENRKTKQKNIPAI